MNAAKLAHDYLTLNGLPKHIISKTEVLLENYKLPQTEIAYHTFEDLLDTFLDLYELEGIKAIEIFKQYLID